MKHNKFSYKIYKSVALLFLLFSLGCASSANTAKWIDSGHKGMMVKKIAVIGMFRTTASRIEFENEIAKKINSKSGTESIVSLEFMEPGEKYEHANMEELFREMEIDGILIVRTKSIERKSTYVPGSSYLVTTVQPARKYYYDYPYYYQYYRYTQRTIREPGYYENSYIVCTESALFLNSDDKMVWMLENITTQKYKTVDGITEPKKEAKRMANLVIKDLNKNGLLMKK